MGLPWLCSDSSDTAAAKRVWACMSLYVTFRKVRRFRPGTKWCEDLQRVTAAAAKLPSQAPQGWANKLAVDRVAQAAATSILQRRLPTKGTSASAMNDVQRQRERGTVARSQ